MESEYEKVYAMAASKYVCVNTAMARGDLFVSVVMVMKGLVCRFGDETGTEGEKGGVQVQWWGMQGK